MIAITALVQGLTGGAVARLLAVREKANSGYAILGANELGIELGRALRHGGEEIIFLDSSIDATQAAKEDGFRVAFGSALEERIRQRAGLDTAAACIGITQNEEVDLLFVRRAREEHEIPRLLIAPMAHKTPKIVRESRATMLFGANTDVALWSLRLRRGICVQILLAPYSGCRTDVPGSHGSFQKSHKLVRADCGQTGQKSHRSRTAHVSKKGMNPPSSSSTRSGSRQLTG